MANNHKIANNHKTAKTSNLKVIMLSGLFTAITAVLAQFIIVVPFSPIPITLQVFAVALAGILLGSRAGALSQAVYVLLGICGLPVFAGLESGIGVLAGPKGGYLAAFPVMAFVIGFLIERFERSGKLTLLKTYFAAAAGLIFCYIAGTAWMGYVLQLTPIKAIVTGMGLFLPFDAIKLAIASIAGYETRKALLKAGLWHLEISARKTIGPKSSI